MEERVHERLPFGVVVAQRKHLLELVDDDEDAPVGVLRRHGRLDHRVEAALVLAQLDEDRLAGGKGVRAGLQDGPEARSERLHRVRAGTHDHHRPRRAVRQRAAADLRHQPRPDDARLAAAGCADDREEPVRAELLDEVLGQRLTSEEVVGVVLVEHLEPAKRTDDGRVTELGFVERVGRDAADAVHEPVKGGRVVEPGTEVNPGQPREEAGQPPAIGQHRARQDRGDDAELRVGGAPAQRGTHLLVLPGPEPGRPDEHDARPAGVDRGLERLLPRLPRDEVPRVEEGLQAGVTETARQLHDRGLVVAVVREEDVVRRPSLGGRGGILTAILRIGHQRPSNRPASESAWQIDPLCARSNPT